jgi:hypothetical protein
MPAFLPYILFIVVFLWVLLSIYTEHGFSGNHTFSPRPFYAKIMRLFSLERVRRESSAVDRRNQ